MIMPHRKQLFCQTVTDLVSVIGTSVVLFVMLTWRKNDLEVKEFNSSLDVTFGKVI